MISPAELQAEGELAAGRQVELILFDLSETALAALDGRNAFLVAALPTLIRLTELICRLLRRSVSCLR